MSDQNKKEKLSEEIISMAAVNACLQTKGVAGMAALSIDLISENIFGKDSPYKGVRVSREKQSYIVDVYVNVCYGAVIPETAWELQSKVKRMAESVSGAKIRKVNIHIQGVTDKKDGEEKNAQN